MSLDDTHYYVPMRSREQSSRVAFTRKPVADMSPAELQYVETMRAAPSEKAPREAAFKVAYAALVSSGGVPYFD